MKRYGQSRIIVADNLRSNCAAMEVIGIVDRQETGRWLNNRAENSHLPFRRQEQAVQRFRRMRSLQKFAAAHPSIHNHFNQERALYNRGKFKINRTAALQMASALFRISLRILRPTETGSHPSDSTPLIVPAMERA